MTEILYEIVWYPEDRPHGMSDRRIRDSVRYADGEEISDFHVPTTGNDYRAVYRVYLHDPDVSRAQRPRRRRTTRVPREISSPALAKGRNAQARGRDPRRRPEFSV